MTKEQLIALEEFVFACAMAAEHQAIHRDGRRIEFYPVVEQARARLHYAFEMEEPE